MWRSKITHWVFKYPREVRDWHALTTYGISELSRLNVHGRPYIKILGVNLVVLWKVEVYATLRPVFCCTSVLEFCWSVPFFATRTPSEKWMSTLNKANDMGDLGQTWSARRHTTEEILVNLLSVGFRDKPDISQLCIEQTMIRCKRDLHDREFLA